MIVRWTVRLDLPAVTALEAAVPDSWTEADLLTALRNRSRVGLVAVDGDENVLAHVVYELRDKHLKVVRLTVRSGRWHDAGVRLLGKLAGKLDSHRRTHIVYDVSEADLAAHLGLKGAGWEAVSVLDDHYRFVKWAPHEADDRREEAPYAAAAS